MSEIQALQMDVAKMMARLDLQFDSTDGTNHMLREIGKALLEFGRSISVIEAQTLRTKNALDLVAQDLRGRYTTVSDRLSSIERRLIEMQRQLERIEAAATREIVADHVEVNVESQLERRVSS